LVDRLLVDLATLSGTNRIEPAHLQIVCDTLWHERKNGCITLQDYEAQGGAVVILETRLYDDLAKAELTFT
jgi:hypothetical protein